MSDNDHYVSTSGDLVDGYLSESARIREELRDVRAERALATEAYANATMTQTRPRWWERAKQSLTGATPESTTATALARVEEIRRREDALVAQLDEIRDREAAQLRDELAARPKESMVTYASPSGDWDERVEAFAMQAVRKLEAMETREHVYPSNVFADAVSAAIDADAPDSVVIWLAERADIEAEQWERVYGPDLVIDV
ncbi:MAG: hypothetical protein JWM41_2893 [Gemmatimonadetes bacterium]|nr:hypothetical protein [Gemmatimonadota bacterium]